MSGGSCEENLTMDRTPIKESTMSAVERILDSLRLSPKWRRQSPVNEKSVKETRIIAYSDCRLTNQHLSPDNRKHATISTSSSDYPETETYDSFSDSAYSQSSETSVNSDRRSLNTTSTDSDNNRLFHQDTSPRSQIWSRGDTAEVTDLDEGYFRRVLMLMKVVLYLRHNFPLKLVRRRRKVYPADSRRDKLQGHDSPSLSSSSMDSQDSSEYSGRSARSRKRISFSPTTLLFSAVTEKAYAEAKSILEQQDLDVNSQTPNGQTLLHIAAANADLKCTQLLIQYGADVSLKDVSGWTPLHAAVRRGNWKCAILLIEAGADFGEYAQTRIQEYNQVLQMSSSYYRSVEIFV